MSSDIQHMLDSQQHVLRLLSQTSAQATAQQIAEAQAWVYVIAAISFYQRNQRKQGDDALVQAVEHQPTLWRQKGIATVEKMCVELPQIPDLAPHLATRFKIPLIVRRVQGRLAMRQFFQAWSDERHDVARQSLWQGVQYNPGWLLNRGIWSFLLKHVLAPRTSL